jgi:aspartate dehydrogenase
VRVGIIGCGAISSVIVDALYRGEVKAELVALMDIYAERCEKMLERYAARKGIMVCRDLESLLAAELELVIEAASQQAVKDYVPRILARGIDVLVLSVGALLEEKLYKEIVEAARRGNAKVYIPTGAIAGVDAVKALSASGIRKVVLRTYKNVKAFDPEALRRLGFGEIRERTRIFEGSGDAAVRLFPANVNVVATLALASGKIPWVEVYADPTLDRNIHEIEVESEASKISIRAENVPHPNNPRTSYLAALSVIQLLKQLAGGANIAVGS